MFIHHFIHYARGHCVSYFLTKPVTFLHHYSVDTETFPYKISNSSHAAFPAVSSGCWFLPSYRDQLNINIIRSIEEYRSLHQVLPLPCLFSRGQGFGCHPLPPAYHRCFRYIIVGASRVVLSEPYASSTQLTRMVTQALIWSCHMM